MLRDGAADHRHRRTGGGRQGHAGSAHRGGARAALPGHGPAVSRGRPARVGRGGRSGRPGFRRGRGARPGPRRPGPARPAWPAGRRRRGRRGRNPRRARGFAGVSARLRAGAWRGTGRSRHRHGDLPRCPGEAVRHRQLGGTCPPPLAGVARQGRGGRPGHGRTGHACEGCAGCRPHGSPVTDGRGRSDVGYDDAGCGCGVRGGNAGGPKQTRKHDQHTPPPSRGGGVC